jgi:hypothetical protein
VDVGYLFGNGYASAARRSRPENGRKPILSQRLPNTLKNGSRINDFKISPQLATTRLGEGIPDSFVRFDTRNPPQPRAKGVARHRAHAKPVEEKRGLA